MAKRGNNGRGLQACRRMRTGCALLRSCHWIHIFIPFLLSCNLYRVVADSSTISSPIIVDALYAKEIGVGQRMSNIDFEYDTFIKSSSNRLLDSLAKVTDVFYIHVFAFDGKISPLLNIPDKYANVFAKIKLDAQRGYSNCSNTEVIDKNKIKRYRDIDFLLVKVENQQLISLFKLKLSRKALNSGFSYVITPVCFK